MSFTRCTSASHERPGEALERLLIALTVNDALHHLEVSSDQSLLDLLRDGLGLTGTKRGCDSGACGACTVLLDGQRVNACLTLAASVNGSAVTTIEGLADEFGGLSPLQKAFAALDALQCGFCTPGQLMSATGLLTENCTQSPSAVALAMSGNLCRCGAYPNIVEAILTVMRKGQAQ